MRDSEHFSRRERRKPGSPRLSARPGERAFRARLLAMAALAVGAAFAPALSAPTAKPPEIARVSGLPTGERLRVLTGPGSAYPIIGALREGDGPIEILESVRWARTEWARISWIEEDAWVARRYLAPIEAQRIGNSDLRVGMSCRGAEPGWSVDFLESGRALRRAQDDPEPREFAIDQALTAEARVSAPAALLLTGDDLQAVLTVDAHLCNDGSSERAYGWRALLLERSGSGARLFEGCCGFPQPKY